MSHADKKPTRAKRAAPRSPALRSGDVVGVRLNLTPAERDQLLAMARDAANNPYDMDNAIQRSLSAKIEAAMARPNNKSSQPGI